METYQKIYIKSKNDLPKKEQQYYVHFKENNKLLNYWLRDHNIDTWLKEIDWYLLLSDQNEIKDLKSQIETLKEQLNDAKHQYISRNFEG